jgi:hypothetical protein
MYLLDTAERLPVTNPGGERLMGDAISLAEFDLP